MKSSEVSIKTRSAYHLNGIFGNNFSTNGSRHSAPAEKGKEMDWVQTNIAADVSLGLQDS